MFELYLSETGRRFWLHLPKFLEQARARCNAASAPSMARCEVRGTPRTPGIPREARDIRRAPRGFGDVRRPSLLSLSTLGLSARHANVKLCAAGGAGACGASCAPCAVFAKCPRRARGGRLVLVSRARGDKANESGGGRRHVARHDTRARGNPTARRLSVPPNGRDAAAARALEERKSLHVGCRVDRHGVLVVLQVPEVQRFRVRVPRERPREWRCFPL